MNNIAQLCKEWRHQKDIEKKAIETRRQIEEELKYHLDFDETKEGYTSVKKSGYKLTLAHRFNRKVDSKLLQEIARENDIESSLYSLFRWKPEIEAKNWQKADKEITDKFLPAIESKPSRPSFKIDTYEGE